MIYAVTIGLVFMLLMVWIVVQSAAQRFARKHPEFGPARKMGVGCCGKCDDHACDREHEQ